MSLPLVFALLYRRCRRTKGHWLQRTQGAPSRILFFRAFEQRAKPEGDSRLIRSQSRSFQHAVPPRLTTANQKLQANVVIPNAFNVRFTTYTISLGAGTPMRVLTGRKLPPCFSLDMCFSDSRFPISYLTLASCCYELYTIFTVSLRIC